MVCGFFVMTNLKVISKKLTPPLKPEHKYYRKQGNKFIICKYINGKTRIFGSVDSEETAKSIVNILFKNNWDINTLPLKFQEYKKYSPSQLPILLESPHIYLLNILFLLYLSLPYYSLY